MKKKLFESIGGNMFKMNENSNVESDIEAQKAMYRNFEIDYSKGVTFSNNLLALYGVGKRGPVWLTSFEDGGGEPMSKEETLLYLKKTWMAKMQSDVLFISAQNKINLDELRAWIVDHI